MGINIGIDIDGTVTDPYGFIPFLNEIFGKNITKEQYTTLDWEQLYGTVEGDFYINFDNNYSYTYEAAEPAQFAVDVIKKLEQSDDINVYFVTARRECLKEITAKWFDKYGINANNIYLLGPVKKSGKALELGCDIFIEDDPNNAMDIAKNGIGVLLIDTNYNKDVECDNITRVRTWKEMDECISNKLKYRGQKK